MLLLFKDMLAAAKAHMSARGEGFQERAVAKMTMEIPLPPLPAAQDRDPDAMKDTRPPKIPTPPIVKEKTELEIMLEMHANNVPPGLFLLYIFFFVSFFPATFTIQKLNLFYL